MVIDDLPFEHGDEKQTMCRECEEYWDGSAYSDEELKKWCADCPIGGKDDRE